MARKIALPLAQGQLCAHFGHCEQFAVITVDDNNAVVAMEKLTPPPHEPGVIPTWLAGKGVDTVLAGGMGERAQAIFAAKGIKVVCGVAAGAPEEIVQRYLNNTLTVADNACGHDEPGHQCRH